MSRQPIAVFDSGLGGLSSVRELIRILPSEDVVYFGDTARVPYGNRSAETVRRFAREDLRFLLRFHPKAVLVACGTISSVALPDLRAMTDVPVIGVIDATVRAAVSASKNGSVGVLGTERTVRSGAYGNAIAALRPEFRVTAQACPLFVPLVEAGHIGNDPLTASVAKEYIRPLIDARVDTVILGCTHYPLLKPLFSDLFGESVALIDAGYEAARETARILEESGQIESNRVGMHRYFVSDEVANFSHVAGMFLNRDIDGQIEKVTIDVGEEKSE